MKIAIDCSKAINERAGVARYTREVATNLLMNFPSDHFLFLYNFFKNRAQKQKLIDLMVDGYNNVETKIFNLPGNLKEWWLTSPFSQLNRHLTGYDIYHAPDFLNFDHGLKIPQILTVHDLSMIKFPDYLGKKLSTRFERILKNACEKADRIIAVSQATKDDIINYFHIKEEKIDVTLQGYDKKFKQIKDKEKIKEVLNKYQVTEPYLLFVGTIEPRKNLSNLFRAFNKFCELPGSEKYKLIIIGKRGWNTSELDRMYENLENRERIIFLNFVPDEDLIYFLNGTELFCYPSIYEGFGLPVIEAMACGAAVLTANNSSLPEVGGEAAAYVNPYNPEEICNRIKSIVFNSKIKENMIRLSLERAKEFSWEKCARETHEVYKKAINEKK